MYDKNIKIKYSKDTNRKLEREYISGKNMGMALRNAGSR